MLFPSFLFSSFQNILAKSCQILECQRDKEFFWSQLLNARQVKLFALLK